MYVSRPSREALDEQMQELDSRISKEEKHRDAQDEKPHDKHEEQRRAKITVTVAAETEGKAKLLLSYVVSNANWTPIYDVGASISHSAKTSSTITLHYRVSITQPIGENRPEVAPTLSTASPELCTAMPTL